MSTQKAFAAHVGVTQSRVSQLIQAGVIQSSGPNGIELDQARLDYIEHLRSLAANRSGDQESDLDLTAERTRKTREEADKLAMENEVRRGDLLVRDDVDKAVTDAFSRVRARCLALPTSIAPLVAPATDPNECETILSKAVRDCLTELSEGPGQGAKTKSALL